MNEIRKAILHRIDYMIPRQLAEEAGVDHIPDPDDGDAEMEEPDLPLRPILWERESPVAPPAPPAEEAENIEIHHPEIEPEAANHGSLVQELLEIVCHTALWSQESDTNDVNRWAKMIWMNMKRLESLGKMMTMMMNLRV